MALNLPGSEASRAIGYASSPIFSNYFRDFIAPSVTNSAITGGYGGASGANQEALARAGEQAAMTGLTSFGVPMAQADQTNAGQFMNYAGLQRQTSLQDFARIQNLIQSLLGYLPTNVSGATTGQTQGPGVGASLLNGAGSLLGSLFNGGLGGSGSSLGASLLGKIPGLSSLFGSSPSNSSIFNTLPSAQFGDTTPSMIGDLGGAVQPQTMLTDSGVDPNAGWEQWLSSSGG